MEDRHRAALAVAAVAVALSGCGGSSSSSDPSDVRDSVTNFVQTFGAGDGKGACALMTPQAQAAFVKRVGGPLNVKDCAGAVAAAHGEAAAQLNLDFAGASVTKVQVNGDSATATVTAGSRSLPANLSKADGSWKLTAIPGL